MVNRLAYGWLLLCALLSYSAHGNELRAQVSHQTVYEQDQFQLILTYPEATQQGDPDFRALEQDFAIIRRQRATNTRIIQGQREATTQWQLTLSAKRTGELEIPSLAFSGHRSQPIPITSKPLPAHIRQQLEQDFFFHVEISRPPNVVQGQLLYIEKLYTGRQHIQSSLTPFTVEHARVQALGEPRQYTTTIDDRRYHVHERRYAIFPDRSGALHIPAQSFQAQVVDNNNPWGRRQAVRIDSKAIDLMIDGIPADYPDAPWLPAKSLSISEQFSQDLAHWRAGEPLTRTITLRAHGLSANQLPALPQQDIEHIRQYPDQPTVNEGHNEQGVISEVHLATALVPSQTGIIELPEVVIPWWDVSTQTTQYARLPARTLNVQASPTVTLSTHSDSPQSMSTDSMNQSADTIRYGQSEHIIPVRRDVFIGWLIVTLLLLVAVLTLLIIRPNQRAAIKSSNKEKDTTHRHNQTEAAAWKQLHSACLQEDAGRIRQCLIHWASLHQERQQNPLTSVAEVLEQMTDESSRASLQPLLHAVDATLYAPHSVTIDGEALWQALQPLRPTRKHRNDTVLKPLYPT